ncbi:MAG: hypothetical protein KF819_11930 [Labilithrix sp.]|nr:hypothetical protein [Labilithrix sp.]
MRPRDELFVVPPAEKSEKIDAPRPAMGSLLSGHPDRRRIDSDVRAFLRQPSTPWITFDKDSRVAPAEILPVRSSVHPDRGFFPATEAIDAAPKVEPSTMAVASDLSDVVDEPAPPPRRRALALGGLTVGAALILTLGVGLTVTREAPPAPRAAGATFTPRGLPVEAPPPDLANAASDPAPAPPAPTVADAKMKYGRLTIDGPARHVHVFLDGKRLLGKGTRSFTVLCGTHTIAIGDKADAKDVDVPCNAELTITK